MKKPSTNDAATGRKLKLARQTLRLLSAAELDVAGGVVPGDATDTCYTCQPCVTTRA
jgi:hypothetical protein